MRPNERRCPCCDRAMKPTTARGLPAWKCGRDDCGAGVLVETKELFPPARTPEET